jgi:hypothetical protein
VCAGIWPIRSFRAASITLRGIKFVHMIKKGQMNAGNGQGLSAAEQFYSDETVFLHHFVYENQHFRALLVIDQ